jgi:hypothetical protein
LEGGEGEVKKEGMNIKGGDKNYESAISMRWTTLKKTHFQMVGQLAQNCTSILYDLNVTFK